MSVEMSPASELRRPALFFFKVLVGIDTERDAENWGGIQNLQEDFVYQPDIVVPPAPPEPYHPRSACRAAKTCHCN